MKCFEKYQLSYRTYLHENEANSFDILNRAINKWIIDICQKSNGSEIMNTLYEDKNDCAQEEFEDDVNIREDFNLIQTLTTMEIIDNYKNNNIMLRNETRKLICDVWQKCGNLQDELPYVELFLNLIYDDISSAGEQVVEFKFCEI